MGTYSELKMSNIFHISATPLVGAPGKIAHAQRTIGHFSTHLALSDYPQKGPLHGKFLNHSILRSEFTTKFIDELILQADIVHIHNDIPRDWIEKLIHENSRAMYVYHVHSPLREGPLYVPRADKYGIDFSLKLAVGQYQPRHYPTYIPVPNLVLEPPAVRPRNPHEKLRVLFSPTHAQVGRWNNKHSDELADAIYGLERAGKIEVVPFKGGIDPATLFSVRRACHVTIDEIATGGFHQVSLEGLCAGNVVINRADYFSKLFFSQFCEGNFPPFLYADGASVTDRICELALDCSMTVEYQRRSFEFAKTYMAPARFARIYDDIYQSASKYTA